MDPIEILLYGVIGDAYDGLDARTIRQLITESEGDIVVRINSGGGYVIEGLAIFNALAEAKAAGRKVTVHIDGLAASMASVIAMVGEEIAMADNALFMIHNPWDVAIGDAEQLRSAADRLDKIRDQLVGIYAGRTGLSANVLTAMMRAETWMNADEALENKFITSITESSTAKAAIKPVDVSKFGFAHVPTGNPLILNINPVTPPAGSSAQASIVPKEKNVDPELIKKILAFAGANNVAAALQAKALTGEITYDEMVAQHNSAVAAAAAAAAAGGETGGVAAATVTRILNYARAHGATDELRDQALTGAITFDQMVDQHTDAVAQADQGSNISTIRNVRTIDASPADEARMRAQMLTVSSIEGLGLNVPQRLQPDERTRAYGEQSVRSIAAFVCRANGITLRADAGDREVIQAALTVQGPQASSGGVISTGDLGNVLGQPVRAVFDAGYQDQLAETTFELYTNEMTVPDFKGVSMVDIGMLSGIKKLSEGGGLPLAKLGDGARFIELGTDGLKVSFTRQAIINDEFGALIQAVNGLGMIFRQKEDDDAMDALVNGVMREKNEQGAWVEVPVFDEDYSNLVTVAALDDDGLATAKAAMRAQRGKGGYRVTGKPRILAVSPDLEAEGDRICGAAALAKVVATKLGDVSTAQAMNLQLIVLDKAPAGTFFLMGAKQFARVVQILRLQGARGPQIFSIPVADRQSLEWGAINDFAAQCIGRLGIVKGVIG